MIESTLVDVVSTALLSLIWLIVMFVPLERMFPARRRQKVFRRGFLTDLTFFFGHHLLFAALAASILVWACRPLAAIEVVTELWAAFDTVPLLVQLLIVWLAGDLVGYFGHRLQHRVDLLWRFHSVHHTAEEVDWLAAHREHPVDGLYTQAMVNLPAVLLGFELGGLLGLIAFRSLWAIFIHSNVRLPLGPLRYLVGSPALHRWHHARDRDAGNYANLAPWIDVVFGTYFLPRQDPVSLGIEGYAPKGYFRLLLEPFLPPTSQSLLRTTAQPTCNQAAAAPLRTTNDNTRRR